MAMRLTLLLCCSVAVLACGAVLRIGYRHYHAVRHDFEPAALSEASRHPERTGIGGLTEVSFPSGEGMIHGWYVPSRNRAAVVLTHGTNADRASMVNELRALAGAGFGVLAFDWPGVGTGQDRVTWGVSERQALAAALTWLERREDVDPRRIGGVGFSMGGYLMTQVAAEDLRLRALVLEGVPTDFAEYTLWSHRQWGALSRIPAQLALRRFAGALQTGSPVDRIAAIAPRPVLIIGGDRDESIPPWMTQKLFAAAREPKVLWQVTGAGHGGYAQAAAGEYDRKLVLFFEQHLSKD